MTKLRIRLVELSDADELAALLVASREHLEPWEPTRGDDYFTLTGQRTVIEKALRLHRLEAGTLVHNVASQKALLANGFERYGLAPKLVKIAGVWQDHVLYQALTDDPTV
ncbi:MAG TPA: hypothetical protein PKG79_01500 [Propioniciclava tarda]|nr:hypothetical protein [Propioniciclava tarda]HQD59680.1 hypothetical protein [Propioniciclava tarda]